MKKIVGEKQSFIVGVQLAYSLCHGNRLQIAILHVIDKYKFKLDLVIDTKTWLNIL